MTTQSQKSEHRREAILNGYRKALREKNAVAASAIMQKHSEYQLAFSLIDQQFTKEEYLDENN